MCWLVCAARSTCCALLLPLAVLIRLLALLACREPVTQLRWFGQDGSLRARLEGPDPNANRSKGMGTAVRQAAAAAAAACGSGSAGEEAHWFQQLLSLAAMY